VYKWSSRALLITGLLLTIGVPFITNIIATVYEIDFFADFPPMQTIHDGYISASFWDNAWMNHLSAIWRYKPFFLLFYMVPVTGIFLFGIWMGRRNYLQQPQKHQKILKRFIAWGLILGFSIQGAILLINSGLENSTISPGNALFVTKDLFASIAVLLISLGYVSSLALLTHLKGWNRFLSILAPAGRMTLTNYVMQSVLIWAIFNGSGLGLYLKVGPSITFFIALALCGLQLGCSYYWLQYFRMGPLEWVWRYANTGKKPEFRMKKPELKG
jgi:uncharacterized protein